MTHSLLWTILLEPILFLVLDCSLHPPTKKSLKKLVLYTLKFFQKLDPFQSTVIIFFPYALPMTFSSILGNLVAGGKVSDNANISNAVNPKWRTAKTHV